MLTASWNLARSSVCAWSNGWTLIPKPLRNLSISTGWLASLNPPDQRIHLQPAWAGVWSRVSRGPAPTIHARPLRVLAALTAAAAAFLAIAVGLHNFPGAPPLDWKNIENRGVVVAPLVSKEGASDLSSGILLLQVHEIDFTVLAEADPNTELRTCGNKTARSVGASAK